MTQTLLNPNLDSSGYSDDNFLQHALDMGAALALVRNSPKLVAMFADSRIHITSIYRDTNDGNFSTPAIDFVRARFYAAPQAAFFHLTNEAGLPPTLGAWSLECATVAENLGRKVVAFNAATNTDVRLWKAHEATIRELTRRGHRIGLHLYLDGLPTHDEGGYAALDYLKSIGAACFITEYGYIRNIQNPNEGYRGVFDDGYGDWLDAHAARLAAYGWPAYLFAIDQWPNSAEGKASGFGTEDRPLVLQRCKALNQRYLLGGTVPPTPPALPLPESLGALQPGIVTPSANFANVRPTPDTSGAALRPLYAGDAISYRPQSFTGGAYKVGAGTLNQWLMLDVGYLAAGVVTVTPGEVDTPIVKLDIPFVSQSGKNASKTNEDCGCADAVSVARYAYLQKGFADPVNFTVDDFAQKTTLATSDTGLTTQQVAALLTGYGVRAQALRQLMTSTLIAQINAGCPVMVLCNYKWLNPNHPGDLGHFIVLYGYGERGFWYNDPYLLGAGQYVENDTLTKAMSDVSTFATWPFQGVVLMSTTPMVAQVVVTKDDLKEALTPLEQHLGDILRDKHDVQQQIDTRRSTDEHTRIESARSAS